MVTLERLLKTNNTWNYHLVKTSGVFPRCFPYETLLYHMMASLLKSSCPKVVLLFVFLALSIVSYAQTEITEGEILRDVNAYQVQYNTAIVDQVGNANASNIELITGSEFEGNLARVIQLGNANNILAEIAGNNNLVYAIQTGSGNEYQLVLSGKDNNIVVWQDGNNNFISQQLTNTQLNNIQIIQQGNNNSLIQTQDGDVPNPNIIVKQIGDGLQMIINNGSY